MPSGREGLGRRFKPVNPTDAVCAKCGEGYGAPCHNDLNWTWHKFVPKKLANPSRDGGRSE